MCSQEVLLESISRAAFEATNVQINLSCAQVECLDKRGRATAVETDDQCMCLRNATGIRVCNMQLNTIERTLRPDPEMPLLTAATLLMATQQEEIGDERAVGVTEGISLGNDMSRGTYI